jgi:hypothetical protein
VTRVSWRARCAVGALGLCSVVPLLAWVYGLGSFAAWFWRLAVPAAVVLGAIAWRVTRSRSGTGAPAGLQAVLVTGTIGGLVGTIGYDLFRVPFVASGLRVLAPIDSYGVLLLDARTSSPLSGFAGWVYHFSNGIGFGIAYAAVALGRCRWYWGVVWALILETATIVTPFADSYALRGKYDLIAIAYAAHVPYGLAVGWAAQRGPQLVAQLSEVSRRTTIYALAALVATLLVWHRPFSVGSNRAATAVVHNRFHPEWIRVPVGGCLTLSYDDGRTEERCYPDKGVHRVRLDRSPYSGGFVIVDSEEHP